MLKSRLISLVIASVLIMTSTSTVWTAEAQPSPQQTQPKETGPSGGAVAAAVISDIVYIPGKTAICMTSGALWTVGMILTAGMIHRQAGDFVHDCCTGKWVLTGEEFMSEEDMPQKEVAFQKM